MANGTFSSPATGGFGTNYQVIVNWSETSNISRNTRTVLISVIFRTSWKLILPGRDTTVTVNGQTHVFTNTPYIDTPDNVTKDYVICTDYSFEVPNDSDGNCTLDISASYAFNATIRNIKTSEIVASGSQVLEPTLRLTKINVPETITLGVLESYRMTKYIEGSRYKAYFYSGDNLLLTWGPTNLYTWTRTLPLSASSNNPYGTTIPLRIKVDTYVDDNVIGSTEVITKAVIPIDICKPQVDDIYINSHGTYPVIAVDKTSITAIVSARLYSGSPIAEYYVSVNGTTFQSSTVSDIVFGESGEQTISAWVVDARGATSDVYSETIYVYPYSLPKATNLSVHRVAASGSKVDTFDGAYCYVSFGHDISPLNNTNRPFSVVVQYKKANSTGEYITIPITTSEYYNELDEAWFPADPDESYHVVVKMEDIGTRQTMYPVVVQTYLSTGFAILDIAADGRSMGIGKRVEHSGNLEVGMKLEVFNDMIFGVAKQVIHKEDTIITDKNIHGYAGSGLIFTDAVDSTTGMYTVTISEEDA